MKIMGSFLIKLYYYTECFVKKNVYKLLYKTQSEIPNSLVFRKGFHLMIDGGFVKFGENVFFNNYCTIDSRSSVEIGDGTIFAENVKIYDNNHLYKDVNVPLKFQGYSTSPIKIGKHCWIATNVVILKGVTIGDNCCIGAGCIVYKDVPEGTTLICKQENLIKKG
jgi:acetyltransferase-like isoleucine patch superfamily enzyme